MHASATCSRVATCLLLIALAGCATSRKLQHSSIQQVRTVADIHQQQVMDNLAVFVYDPNSFPYFSIPQGGSADVTDLGRVSSSINWIRTGFSGAQLGGDASRAVKEGWTLIPENDPHRLELMRCAYQQAVRGCSCAGQIVGECPDCGKRFKKFYGTRPTELTASGDLKCVGSCWFKVGCDKCVPKHVSCGYVGRHCGICVWVDTPHGRDELAKLTLKILEFSEFTPVTPKQQFKQIVKYYDEHRKPTTKDKATSVETYDKPIRGPIVETTNAKGEATFGPATEEELPLVPRQRDSSIYFFERQRQTLYDP